MRNHFHIAAKWHSPIIPCNFMDALLLVNEQTASLLTLLGQYTCEIQFWKSISLIDPFSNPCHPNFVSLFWWRWCFHMCRRTTNKASNTQAIKRKKYNIKRRTVSTPLSLINLSCDSIHQNHSISYDIVLDCAFLRSTFYYTCFCSHLVLAHTFFV